MSSLIFSDEIIKGEKEEKQKREGKQFVHVYVCVCVCMYVCACSCSMHTLSSIMCMTLNVTGMLNEKHMTDSFHKILQVAFWSCHNAKYLF